MKVPQELADLLDQRARKKHSAEGSVMTTLGEILALYGPMLLREVAADWEALANKFELIEYASPKEEAAVNQLAEQYRHMAALLRGRARAMELEPFIE